MTHASIQRSEFRRVTGWPWFALVVCFASGCESTVVQNPSASTSVMILYEENPLSDVQIRLHEVPDGPVLAQSITGPNGRAAFDDLPSPEPQRYVVSIESVSDGGWILDTRVIERSLRTIELAPFAEQPNQQIALPRRAVKTL